MKIAFHDSGRLDFTPDTPYRRPLGGAQSAMAYLAAALAARGHEVSIFNRTTEPGISRGVQVFDLSRGTPSAFNAHDVVVSSTLPLGALFRRNGVTVPLVMWQHQAAVTERVRPFGDAQERAAWTAFVFVSDDQRAGFVSRFGIDGAVLRNAASPGVLAAPLAPTCFLDRGEDPIFIYASGPGHGLELTLTAFAAIRERLPGARLQVCSDEGIYQDGGDSDPYTAVYALARALPGVEFVGALSQERLGEQFARADVLAYPSNLPETSCIVAMEAASAGCAFMGADLGALRETMAGYGAFTPFVNSRALLSKSFAAMVAEAVASARADPETYKRRRLEQAAYFRQTHTWERRAEEWEAWLESFLASPVAARL